MKRLIPGLRGELQGACNLEQLEAELERGLQKIGNLFYLILSLASKQLWCVLSIFVFSF
jgi:hypothetical protein